MSTYDYVIINSNCDAEHYNHHHARRISDINGTVKNALPKGAVISNVEIYLDSNFDSVFGTLGSPTLYFYFCPDDESKYNTGEQLYKGTVGKNSTISRKDITSYVTKTYPFSINTSYPVLSLYYASTTKRLYHDDLWKIIYTYSVPKYTLTVTAGTGGTVSGGGSYDNQTTVTLTATPNAGYKFVQWSDGVTSAVRAVSVTGNATYTAQFRPIYISYDSIFSFKRWADNGIGSGSGFTVSNLTDAGFTGTATVDDAYTAECRPLIPVEIGKEYTIEFEANGGGFELFVFNCDANGAWNGSNPMFTMKTNTKKFNFVTVTNYVSIRCDVVGAGTVVNFSNFRIYPANYPYMSNSVSATGRTGRGGQAMPTPTRVGYAFTGWNTKPDGSGATYTASNLPTDDIVLYSQWTIKTFKVTFKNENGATLKTETVNYNSTVTAPTDPVKADTAQHKYTFDGWYDANGNKWYPNTAITGDTVYTARFNSTVQRYTVKWYNEDGSILLETDELVPYGTIPDYNGATPTKAETAAATYEHIGWSIDVNSSGTTELTAVIEAVDYYARFRAINKTYTVVWQNDDGTVLETDTAVPYDAIPDYNGTVPTKDDEQFDYTFLGWSANVEDPPLDDTELPTVTGNITYTAVYEKTPKIFLVIVTMLTDKGDILGEYLIRVAEYGRELVIEAEENAGYRFVKWTDGNTDRFRTITVTASVDYEAIYERVPVPIIVNEDQPVTGVYIVPTTQTIVYVISGEVPTVVADGVTVDDWSFRVSNSVPDNSYPIEKLYINETRVY